ncbi:MAG: DUF1501 domain-containing protein [Armatimonadetes bacterium]|nr:DUF1501 domain-containing protein [Armatimonadota bacterium]
MPRELNQALTRRRLLRGGSALGLNLGALWQAQAAAAEVRRNPAASGSAGRAAGGDGRAGGIRACIFLFHYGGPSHHDTFDMKPEAPAEVRGTFGAIPTSADGIRICEHLPQLAKQMHRIALVRSMHHRMTAHDSASANLLTGRPPVGGDRETFPDTPQTYPAFGAILSRVWQPRELPVPWAALPFVMNNVLRNPGQTPGFLGGRCAPFQIEVDPARLAYHAETLRLPEGVGAARLGLRRGLLRTLEDSEAPLSAVPETAQSRVFYEKAFHLLDSVEVRRALEIERETPKTRERYGLYPGPGGASGHPGYASPMRGQNLLLARRLVEAGVPFVNVYDFKQQGQNWDSHDQIFTQLKEHLLPPLDRGLSALLSDLDERGLLDSTLVVSVGEFGRTPKINASAGRDHWPFCYTALLAGGGVRGGAVYGASDATGAYPDADPVTPGDLAATIFERFQVDPHTAIYDATNRPFPAAEGEPLRSLF